MIKEIKCPGENLEKLLIGINLGVLDQKNPLIDEPDVNEITSMLEDIKDISKQDLDGVCKRYFHDYHQLQITASELRKWGNSEREVRKNLRYHVLRCEECSKTYTIFLINSVMTAKYLLAKLPKITQNRKRAFFRTLKDYDKSYLRLFSII